MHFHKKTEVQTNRNRFLQKLKLRKLEHVYAIMEIHDASPSSAAIIQRMAPPPPSVTPFLLENRFTVFFTLCPPDDCFLVVPHVDAHGSGPLVHGPSVTGSFTSVAVCTPDYSKKKEVIPPELIFQSETSITSPTGRFSYTSLLFLIS